MQPMPNLAVSTGWHWWRTPWGSEVIRYRYGERDEWSDGLTAEMIAEGWVYLREAKPPSEAIEVSRKLLEEVHACMRACGWQDAQAVDDGSDGVLAGAATLLEASVGALLAVKH